MKRKQTLFQINDYALGLRDVIQFFIALAFFLGLYYTMSNTLQTQGDQIQELKSNVKELDRSVNGMNARLSRMEGALGIKQPSPQSFIQPTPTPLAQLKEPSPLVINIEEPRVSGSSASVVTASSEATTHTTENTNPSPVITGIPMLSIPILGTLL